VQVGACAAPPAFGVVPWLRLRQGYLLLRLCERHGQDRVDALCARALAFDVIDVPRLELMLKEYPQAEAARPPPLPVLTIWAAGIPGSPRLTADGSEHIWNCLEPGLPGKPVTR
jgi:hypothetical protein